MKFFTTFLLSVAAVLALGQAKLWEKQFGLEENQIAFLRQASVLPDGSSIFLGESYSGVVQRFAADGSLMWRYQEPPLPGVSSRFLSFTQDASGDIIALGEVLTNPSRGFLVRLGGTDGVSVWRTWLHPEDTRMLVRQVFPGFQKVVVLGDYWDGSQFFTELWSFSASTGAKLGTVRLPVRLVDDARQFPNGDLVARTLNIELARVKLAGTVVWTHPLPLESIRSMYLGPKGLLLVSGQKAVGDIHPQVLERIDPADGTPLWDYNDPDFNASPITPAGGANGEVFATFGYRVSDVAKVRVVRLDPVTGTHRWTRDLTDQLEPNALYGFAPRQLLSASADLLALSTISGPGSSPSNKNLGVFGLNPTDGRVKFRNIRHSDEYREEVSYAMGLLPSGALGLAGSHSRANAFFFTTWQYDSTTGARLARFEQPFFEPTQLNMLDARAAGNLYTGSYGRSSLVFESFDGFGKVLWRRTIRRTHEGPPLTSLGSLFSFDAFSTSDGAKVAALGHLNSFADLLVFSASGDLLCNRSLDDLFVWPRNALVGATGDIYVFGAAIGYVPSVARFKSDGTMVWIEPVQSASGILSGTMLRLPDGNLVVSSELNLQKVSAENGAVLWNLTLAGKQVQAGATDETSICVVINNSGHNELFRYAASDGAFLLRKTFAQTDTLKAGVALSLSDGFATCIGATATSDVVLKINLTTGAEAGRLVIPAVPGYRQSYKKTLRMGNDVFVIAMGDSTDASATSSGILHRLSLAGVPAWLATLAGGPGTASGFAGLNLDATGNPVASGWLGSFLGGWSVAKLVTTAYAK